MREGPPTLDIGAMPDRSLDLPTIVADAATSAAAHKANAGKLAPLGGSLTSPQPPSAP